MRRTLASSAVALIVGAGPVLAELTPAQVWENLESYYSDMGYQVTTGAREDAGNRLNLSDIVISIDAEQSDSTITIPQMTLEQTGDAKVRTVIDGEMTISTRTELPDQEPFAVNMVMTAPGNEMLSSGSTDDMTHEFKYPSLDTEVRFGDENSNDGEVPLTIALTDLAGQYHSVKGEGQDIAYDATVAGLDLKLDMVEPPSGAENAAEGKLAGEMHMDGVTITGQTVLPKDFGSMTERLDLALNAGFLANGKVELGEMTGSGTFEGMDPESGPQSGSGKFTSEGGNLTFAMAKDGLSYEGATKATEVEVTVDQLPFPISYSLDSSSGSATFPVSASEQAQPFSLKYQLVGLTLADGIWNLFDPGKELPRDPANLTIDVAGDALVRKDLFDPAFAQDPAKNSGEATDSPEMPFEPQSVKINSVVLQAAGVDANVTGDLTVPQGAKQPVGILEGSFTGVNALLEKLVSIGLVPQEQLMGARMMLAMFAKPVEGNPDQLETKLEFKEDGSIFANGQQVQ